MNSLVLTETQWNAFVGHFAHARERTAYAFAGVSTSSAGTEVLVREIDLPCDEEYRNQSAGGVTLGVEGVLARVMKAKTHAAFVDAHSHPFSVHPRPSPTDDDGAAVQMRVLGDLAPGVQLARMIFGKGANVWAEIAVGGDWVAVDRIVVIGLEKRAVVIPVNARDTTNKQMKPADLRTAAVMGDEAVQAVRNTHLLIIGGGGVGSAVAVQLRGYVNEMDIVDPDVVEAHNAPRLYHYVAGDEGTPKVDVHRREIRRSFPECRVRILRTSFPDKECMALFKQADVVVCAPDHNSVRHSAASAAARFMKPLIEIGCGGRRVGAQLVALGYHVRLQVPAGPCLACNGLDLRDLEDRSSSAMKRDIGYITGGDEVAGELMPLTTRAAADAVDIFLRYAAGYLPPVRHLYFDALRFQTLDLSQAYSSMPACTLCGSGEASIAGTGDSSTAEHQILSPPIETASTCASPES